MVSRFIRKEDGVVAVLFALLLPVLIGGVALGVEMGLWFLQRAKLQHVADSAAYSAAVRLSVGAPTNQAQQTAAAIVAQGGFDTVNDVTVAPLIIDTAADPDRVTVTLTRDQERFFTRIFLPADPAVSVRAVAEFVPVITAPDILGCMIALSESTTAPTFQIGAGNSRLILPRNCDVLVNSTRNPAFEMSGNSQVSANCLRVRGGISPTNLSRYILECGAPVTGVAALFPDPFSGLPRLDGSLATSIDALPCTFLLLGRIIGTGNAASPLQIDPQSTLTIGGSAVPARRYCGDVIISGFVDFQPGLYIFDRSLLNATPTVTSSPLFSATVTTSGGATFFFRGNAAPDFDNGFNGTLTPPSTGPFAGVSMFGYGTAPFQFAVNSSTARTMTGAIYAPSARVDFTGSRGQTVSLGCFQVVSNTIALNGNNTVVNVQCPQSGTSFTPVGAVGGGAPVSGGPTTVRLIQ